MAKSWDDAMVAAQRFRRELHQQPELPWAEHQTATKIRNELTRLGITWRECAGTGTVAILAAAAQGRHVALRADIDALPITETSGVEWSSQVEGCMHACGHDGHTAALVGTAQWLAQHEQALPGPVTLLFQPAEEGGHGAKRMIEEGALEGVEAIYGWHNWPAIAFGQAVCPDGTVMAGNGSFFIRVNGSGGHASQPDQCRDPVVAAAAITLALQQIVSRRLPPQQATVVSVTSIDARSGNTVIPDHALIGGSIRLADPNTKDTVNDLIKQVAEDVGRGYGVNCHVELVPRYGPTINDATEAARFRDALQAEFGSSALSQSTALPIMASEDFSYYLNEVPGAFALLGSDDGERHGIPCHSPRYDFNDALLPHVARLYARLAGAPLPDAPLADTLSHLK